jgi:hypothetical protein
MAKGFLQSAGQVKQPGELEKVVGEQQRRPHRIEAMRDGEDDAQPEVQPSRQGDQREARANGERKLEP